MAFPSFPCGTPHQVLHPNNGFSHTSGATVHLPNSVDGEHQLEKLEFALAVALTRGDQDRSNQLRCQIAALGGNCVEPGT
ncbi:MAG: hypothetical protein VKK98_06680 [Cyanobacteriota bacterium]|nr:hypothetical protein [Cyanobacteriota bacterium]